MLKSFPRCKVNILMALIQKQVLYMIYFETCFKIIWFIYLIAIRIYLTLLSKGQMFNIPFRGRNFKIELKYPESIGEFFISTMLSFAITMLIFIGIQTLYEKVFITNNINR